MNTNITKNIVDSKVTGTRRISGTDWPIETYVYRVIKFDRVYWLVTTGVCNGIAHGGSKKFKTKKAALEYAGIN